jgi:hypothetical protein
MVLELLLQLIEQPADARHRLRLHLRGALGIAAVVQRLAHGRALGMLAKQAVQRTALG